MGRGAGDEANLDTARVASSSAAVAVQPEVRWSFALPRDGLRLAPLSVPQLQPQPQPCDSLRLEAPSLHGGVWSQGLRQGLGEDSGDERGGDDAGGDAPGKGGVVAGIRRRRRADGRDVPPVEEEGAAARPAGWWVPGVAPMPERTPSSSSSGARSCRRHQVQTSTADTEDIESLLETGQGMALPCLEESARTRRYPRRALLYAALLGAGSAVEDGPQRGGAPAWLPPGLRPAAELPAHLGGGGAVGGKGRRGSAAARAASACSWQSCGSAAARAASAGSWRSCGAPALGPVLTASETGYRISSPNSRTEEIRRSVNSLLNKICPENLGRIVSQMAGVQLESAGELELVIGAIFQAALANSHHVETYSDMVFALKTKYPEFHAEEGGGKFVTFARVLLDTCQQEFESLPDALQSPEVSDADRRDMVDKNKERFLANMRFLGHLFLRNLLSTRIVQVIVEDLLGSVDDNALPEEHMVEGICELLTAIGYTLERSCNLSRRLLHDSAHRLEALQAASAEGGAPAYSKRIRFRIDDLLDLRRSDWQQRMYHERAKTLDDIRRDAVKEWANGGCIKQFPTAKAGSQPAYILAAEAEAKKLGRKAPPAGADADASPAAALRPRPRLRLAEPPSPSEPLPEPAAEPSPSLASASSPRSSAGGEFGPAGGLPIPFDRAFVGRLAGRLAATSPRWDGGFALRSSWREAAPTSEEAVQGAQWLLEAHLCGPWAARDRRRGRETVVRGACELLGHGHLAWPQLARALRHLVAEEAAEGEGGPSGGIEREAVFCAVFLRTLEVGLFHTAAFRALPTDRDDAWRLLVGVLKLAAEGGCEGLRRRALGELWEVLCAVRGVPVETSERELFRQLARQGLALPPLPLGV